MGIDFNRADDLSHVNIEDLTCAVCKLLLNNPCMCGTCKTHFCYECLSNYMKMYSFSLE